MHRDVGKRIMAVLLSICMIAGMVDWSGFTARAADEEWHIENIALTNSATKTYDGSQKSLDTSDVEITVVNQDGLNSTVLSTDEVEQGFTFTYDSSNRVKAGRYGVTIAGIESEGYYDSQKIFFDVKKKEFSETTVTVSGIEDKLAQVNDPVSQKVTVKDIALDSDLTEGTDYRINPVKVSLTESDGASAQGTIEIIALDTGNYEGTITKTFMITKMDAANLQVALKEGEMLTTSADSKWGGYYAMFNGKKQTLGENDIEVEYNNDPISFDDLKLDYDPGSNLPYVGDVKVKVGVQSGKYAGLVKDETIKFRIIRGLGNKNVTPITVTGLKATRGEDGNWVIDYENATFNDPYASETVKAIPAEQKFKVDISESSLPSPLPPIYNGTCKVTARTDAEQIYYTGSMTNVPITLETPKLTDNMIHILDENGVEKREYEFDGSTDWVQKIVDDKNRIRVGSEDNPYIRDTDYTVAITRHGVNANQGNDTYALTVTPKGNRLQGDPVVVPIKVKPMQLVEVAEGGKITINAGTAEYTGSPVSVSTTLSYVKGDGNPQNMIIDQDYEVVGYRDNTNASERAYVVLRGKGNFSGTCNKYFTITPKALTETNTTITGIANGDQKEYEGKPIEPTLTIRVNGISYVLQKDRDYTVSYLNSNRTESHENVSDGTITMTIVGTGNFQGGNFTRTFDIVPRALNNTDIRRNYVSSHEYTGQDITPEITLTYQRAGVTKNLVLDVDYTVKYSNNKNVTTKDVKAEIIVTGEGNFKDSLTYTFDITPCNLSTTPNLIVQAEDATGEIKGLTSEATGDKYLDVYYIYKGNGVKIPEDGANLPQLSVLHNGNQIAGADYKVEYQENLDIGRARIVITGTDSKNYSGSKTFYYAIKGDLSDYATGSSGRTNIEIEAEEYTKDIIVPKNVKVTFRTDSEVKELKEGTDYKVENVTENSIQNNESPVGWETARITGQGLYVNFADKNFEVIPLSLDKDRDVLEKDYKYKIDKVKTQYTYSGLPITPEPEITHSGKPVAKDTEYELEYYAYANGTAVGTQIGDITDGSNFQVGSHYGLRINGRTNYKDYIELPYEITQYNLKTGLENGKIELANVAEAVVLDHVKYPDASPDATLSPALPGDALATNMALDEEGHPTDAATDGIVWEDLQVMYTPVDIDGNTVLEDDGVTTVTYALRYGIDYTVTYENNTEPGTATYTIRGVEGSNFTGEFTEEFKILADLSSENTTVEAADCTFKPSSDPARPANEPEVTVKYVVKMVDGTEKEITLNAESEDYTVSYAHNDRATKGPENDPENENAAPDHDTANPPAATITATADGFAYGSNSDTFEIFQRVLSEEEDSGLVVEGDLEYEYTGAPIVPDLEITCDGVALIREDSGTVPYDYGITAEHNLNVWTFEDAAQTIRLNPTATISARKGADDDRYTGNYFGEFEKEFKITPRKLDRDAEGVTVEVVNKRTDLYSTNKDGEWECEYTRKPITFPDSGESVPYPNKNGLDITWKKGNVSAKLTEGTDYTVTYEDNVKIGDAKIWIEAPDNLYSNYTGRYDQHFKIMATIAEVDNDNPLNGVRYMELVGYGKNDRPNVYYGGGVEVIPELKFEDISGPLSGDSEESYILEQDKDFVILTQQNCAQYGETKYSTNNVNVSGENETAKLVIKGIGYYTGIVEREYKIIPKDFSDDRSGITVQFVGSKTGEGYENGYVYNGQAQRPTVKVFNNNIKDLENPGPDFNPYDPKRELKSTEYEIVGYYDNKELSTEDKKAYVLIRGKGPNYSGEHRFYFMIIRKPIDEADCVIAEKPVYNGRPQTPEVQVSYMDAGKKVTLVAGTDYDIAYENNTEAADASAENAPEIVLTGKGGYGGVARIKFTISPKNINSEDITATGSALYKNGEPVEARVAVTDNGAPAERATLVKDTDFTLSDQSNQTGIGEQGTVTVTGTGNYTGTRTATFRILPPDGTFQIEPIEAQEYNTKPIQPKVKVNLLVQDSDMSVELTEGLDYDVAYANCQNAGVATVTVTGKDIFLGKRVTASYAINPKSIGADGVIDASMIMGDIKDYQFTGTAIVPAVDLRFQLPAAEGAATPGEAVPLVVGRDYQVTCVNNTSIGVATATVTGINNYSGTITREFRILGNMNMATVAPIPTQQYTGSAVTPEPMVSMGGMALVKGVHYTVEYRNNVERGTASIILTGIGEWLSGTKTVTFDIARELSDSTVIRGVAAAYTYTGAAIAPPVRVEEEGSLLVNGVDYQVIYEQNVNAGTATITIMGINKYSGSRTVTFRITPQQLGRATVAPVEEQIYDGQEKNPPVTVTSGTTTLENGRDYNLVYVNSATPGMASIIIKGEGNYTGTQTVNYNIAVPEITGVKTSKYTNKSITLSWTKNSAVSGYEIYNSKNRRDVRITKPGTTKGTISKLKAGTGATFRVRAYVNKDGQYYYGPFTSIKTATAPDSTKISSIASNKAKQVTVKWKKVKGATQYEVYRSTKSKSGYKKIGTTKKTSYTDKKATGGKKYYYKIRVCKKIDKKNYYSSYSAVKSVTAKK